jgi:serine protease inhibitor
MGEEIRMKTGGIGRAAASIAVCVCLALTACGKKTEMGEAELKTPDRALLAQKADPQITAAWNTFGLELIRQVLVEKPGVNVILSPASVAQALAMTWNGASGSTFDAMAETMRLQGMDLSRVNRHAGVMSELLGKSSPGVQMSMANSLWLQKGWPFRKEFLDSMRKAYEAKLEQRELTEPKVRKEINSWVKKETHGRIPTIIDQPIDASAKLMLINALYLNASWQTPFEKSATKDGSFKQADGSEAQVPMMHQKGRYAYEETEGYQAVRLPYGDGQLSMLIILPKPEADRAALMKRLFADPTWWMKQHKASNVDLTLPKFRVDFTVKLRDTLSKMGMGAAFDPSKADFSAMASADASHPPLYISQVLHKTYLDVNEQGTEAAAVTLVEMKAAGAQLEGSVEMKVDRPFWFAITDDQSHTLLFAGAVERLSE